MKKALKVIAAAATLASSQAALATPSTVFWTPATTYVQPFLVPHITYDTYFGDRAFFPIDTGLTIGILPFDKVQAEVGFDLFFPYANYYFFQPASPLMLNAKLGLTEGAFGDWFPGISAGIYGAGFKYGTEYDIWHGEIGKTTPIGTFTVGGYYGAGPGPLWTGSEGVKRTGFIGAYLTPDVPINLTGLNKINFFGDVQTGKNAYGAWGVGIGLYFTPAIDILTGPIFFLDKAVQPGQQSVMWTIQLDVDVDFRKPAAPAK